MADINRDWVVLLEATDEHGSSVFDVDDLRRLIDAVADGEQGGGGDVTALYNPRRYALQLRVAAGTAAEALFSAAARWGDAVRRLQLPVWDLARAEVLTPEEFAREMAADLPALENRARVTVGGPPATSLGDDLLARAFHDSLTGLPTGELFRDRVRTALIEAPMGKSKHAVFVLDLDDFARLNRQWGHAAGDQVLITLGERLRTVAGPAAEVARYGGDAFALMVDGLEPDQLQALGFAIRTTVSEPIDLGAGSVSVTASVGLATNFDTADVEEVVRNAETAMCAVKGGGGDGIRWFEAGLTADLSRLEVDVDPAPDHLGYVLLLERAALAANECETPLEAAAVALQQVCAHTGWLAGQLYNICPKSGTAQHQLWHATMPERYDRLRGDGSGEPDRLVRQVIETGRPTWSTDLAEDTELEQADAAREAGIRAAFAFPVMAGSQVVSILEFFGGRAARPDEPLLAIMTSVGTQLGRIVERERAKDALAQSEEIGRAHV